MDKDRVPELEVLRALIGRDLRFAHVARSAPAHAHGSTPGAARGNQPGVDEPPNVVPFVVAASAVYVMSLSGELLQITSGTLILLGIAGAAGIGAKVDGEARAASAEVKAAAAEKAAADAQTKAAEAAAAPADAVAPAAREQTATDATAKAAAATSTRARAAAMRNAPPSQVPRWSDLIVKQSVMDDGTTTRELDVARFQMLLFTLITAAFVLMSVVTTYVIPEIPTGFVTLMGISNGVYLAAKVAQGS